MQATIPANRRRDTIANTAWYGIGKKAEGSVSALEEVPLDDASSHYQHPPVPSFPVITPVITPGHLPRPSPPAISPSSVPVISPSPNKNPNNHAPNIPISQYPNIPSPRLRFASLASQSLAAEPLPPPP
ncbi:hypothetical protein VC83_00281 [Pseudogymnoascus destructans]|uniref:Uncharacterized protein n=1 Tax=Pseudogymnoascus destructans TaxID=655981 RepID=A0A177ALX8_9PEZI|nr:uncharacterized protein VC83_00281 [Pseudogymnoascus destructans]OAF63035.1 hypothetical protein VC83_00281 [Pseudogymnoascus destructans]